jgi:hypothetical protein
MKWFLVEADITVHGDVDDSRLEFFTVLIVKQLPSKPTMDRARAFTTEYLNDAHLPFEWDQKIVSVEEIGPPPDWVQVAAG